MVTVKDPQDLDIFVNDKKDEILEERGRRWILGCVSFVEFL